VARFIFSQGGLSLPVSINRRPRQLSPGLGRELAPPRLYWNYDLPSSRPNSSPNYLASHGRLPSVWKTGPKRGGELGKLTTPVLARLRCFFSGTRFWETFARHLRPLCHEPLYTPQIRLPPRWPRIQASLPLRVAALALELEPIPPFFSAVESRSHSRRLPMPSQTGW